jgi:hypothetical protein
MQAVGLTVYRKSNRELGPRDFELIPGLGVWQQCPAAINHAKWYFMMNDAPYQTSKIRISAG